MFVLTNEYRRCIKVRRSNKYPILFLTRHNSCYIGTRKVPIYSLNVNIIDVDNHCLSSKELSLRWNVTKRKQLWTNICIIRMMWTQAHLDYVQFINILRPRQHGRHFADDTFKRIFVSENVISSIKISLKFVPKGQINNNNPALVQIMAWRLPDGKFTGNDGKFTDAYMRHSASMS